MAWASVVVGAGSALYGAIKGGQQKREGRKLLSQKNPQYNIPDSVTSAASQGMPSEQYQQAMQNVGRAGTVALSGAQDRGAGLASIGQIQQRTNDATLNLDVTSAKMRQQNQRILAGYQDKQWMLNSKQPYDKNYNYGMQLLGAGNQNQSNAVDQLGSTIGNAAYMGAFNQNRRGGSSSGGGGYSFTGSGYNAPGAGQDYSSSDYQIPN